MASPSLIVPTRGRICSRCVMDESDPDLSFDEAGLCDFCRAYDAAAARGDFDLAQKGKELPQLVDAMKREGRGRPYDCIMGVSGGADSSYAAYVAVRDLGLRALAIHVDNGWNSELAVKNVEVIVRGLGMDLVTYVIDWDEFRDLQLALLRASVVDLELVSDHAILAGMYATARRFRVRWIATGDNSATEVTLPRTWNHRKTDLTNIKAIHRRFGSGRLRTFPTMSTVRMWAMQKALRIRTVPLLSYVPYVKADAMRRLNESLGWKPYPGKHYESVITRFYQGYILPVKFGIDKRRIHLSRLICTGQIARGDALAELEKDPYEADQLASDKEFVAKKFGLTEAEFDLLMAAPRCAHDAFATDARVVQGMIRAAGTVRSIRETVRRAVANR